MNWQHIAERIHDHLREPSTRQRLNSRFASARDQLTTSIGEATKLAGVPAEKARYAEAIGMLTPRRSRENKGGAHRRYSLGELNRLIVMGDLIDHGFSMGDIAHYLNRERNTTDMLIENIQSSDLATRLREAETSHLQRMLIPRLLYLAQCLLLGDVVDCSIAIVLPVETEATGAPIAPINSVDGLPDIGPSLIGWRSRSHPYCVLYMREPRMDDTTRYEYRSIDEMCREANVAEVDEQPTGAYLLIEREFAHLLSASAPNRPRADSEGGPSTLPPSGAEQKKYANPRAAAYRLLRMLRQPADEEHHTFGHSYSSVGDGMLYNSPEFSSNLTGDRLLTEITELVVRLGNDLKTDASSPRGRWVYSAILLPDNLDLPSAQQSLVVTAQSEKSPHVLGVTRLTPSNNEELSTMAALSGHMILRQALEPDDAAIGDGGYEESSGPALALPIISTYGRVLAVLYVRSRYEENTSTNDTFTLDDQLLLRVVGHIIGGIVFTYRGNYLARDMVAGMIQQPRSVDHFFQEFKTANSFWADLEVVLRDQIVADVSVKEASTAASAERTTNPVTVLAIDIDRHTDFVNTHGSNTARHLIRAVGRSIAGQPLLTSSPLMGATKRTNIKLYHIYGDRFFLLLENISEGTAHSYARNLRDLLTTDYTLEITRTVGTQTAPVGVVRLENVSVRIAVISYNSETLSGMLTSVTPGEGATLDPTHEPVQHIMKVITDALDTGLNQGKQKKTGAIMYLDTGRGLFRLLPEDNERSSPRNTIPLAETIYDSRPARDFRRDDAR